ncbi:hypothetical protein [Shouchella shacheensis]|uniref:hypothetical protein n=1 Tax=Shouchella shacheensis TaxID=1649580 RepID=UPI0007404BC3|nr:hypothetical protein [Shouchella shacheensis]
MHTKQTVRYICEFYPSGRSYYYKQEYITHDSWQNLDSVAWSAPRPIRKKTFLKREKEGYTTEYRHHEQPPAVILPFRRRLEA